MRTAFLSLVCTRGGDDGLRARCFCLSAWPGDAVAELFVLWFTGAGCVVVELVVLVLVVVLVLLVVWAYGLL